MNRKILNILIIIVMVLSMSTVVAAQDGGFTAEPLSPESTNVSAEFKEKRVAPVGDQLAAVQDLEVVSLIVTFNESVDASDLAAATGGQVIHRYEKLFNGASIVMAGEKVESVAGMEGITGVYLDEERFIDTDSSNEFIGSPAIWEALGGQENAGEGVVVGIVDSGIWPEHPSFSDPDPNGKAYDPPAGGPYPCEFGNTAWNPNDAPFECNNKLIGAYNFLDTYKAVRGLDADEFDSARDADGHGTHTASTAAGNAGVAASIMGADWGIVSGVAPRAQVIAYHVCAGPTGSCFVSDSAAAIEQAILDGVDVINFSIGGGSNPYSDAVSLAFLAAYENGVFVAASAGNSGPGANTTGHREPWTTTVAASTQTRTFEGTLSLVADNSDTLELTGVTITGGHTADVVLAADFGDGLCLNPFPADTWTNSEIVVCERGAIARVAKSGNVAAGGAGGMVLYNPGVQTLNSDNHFVPSLHIDDVSGVALVDFLTTHSGVVGTLSGGAKVDGQGDVMAAFSSRGGAGQTLGISKPDITAPGVNIMAGHTPMPAFPIEGGAGVPGQYFQSIGGTSMSSPHIAGSGALLKALHPDWTPGQIKSALMMTALTEGVVKEDGVTPADAFDYGSGRVNLNKAGNPGLTISATAEDFVNLEAELWNSNYPSLYIPVMPGAMTVERTLKSERSKYSCWVAEVDAPEDVKIEVTHKICIPAGGEKTIEISIDASGVPLDEVRFATVYFVRGDKEALRFPITIVRRMPAITMEKTCDPAEIELYGTTDCTITIENTTFDDAEVSLYDRMPQQLRILYDSVIGGTRIGGWLLTFDGSLAGAEPPLVSIGEGISPAGYLPLSIFGIAPYAGQTDESCVTFDVPGFVYAGEVYTSIGAVSNGYAVVGGCSGDDDIEYINQILPDPSAPNNVLAPFWTDLNPDNGGLYYAGILSDGVNDWLILEWEEAPNWGDAELNSFQIWIGLNGYEDISFTYGETLSDGDGGWLTVGAEDINGLSGENYYVDGVGTPPAFGTDVVVTSVPGAPGEVHEITYTARAKFAGEWVNCAEMTSDAYAGTNIACFEGAVIP